MVFEKKILPGLWVYCLAQTYLKSGQVAPPPKHSHRLCLVRRGVEEKSDENIDQLTSSRYI